MTNNWQKVPIGKVTIPAERSETPIPGKMYRQIGVRLWGEGAYERESIDGGNTRYAFFSRVEKDDIVVNKIWARNGSVAVVPEELAGCFVSTEFPIFALIQDRVYPRWFHWITKTRDFWEQCDAKSRGTSGKNRIRPEQFLAVQIPLPPLPEQQRIVARVDALARRVEEARGLRRAAVEEVEPVIYSALGQIFSDEATQDWEHKKVEEICHSPQYGYTESAQVEKVGPKFLRITDIQDGRVNWDAVPYCICNQSDLEKYRLKAGDIVFARTGATTGKSFLLKDCPEAVFASYLIRLRVKGNVLPAFLLWYFQSPRYWDQVKAETKGSAQGNMNGKKLSAVNVLFPNSEAEQRRIVAYLDGLQAKVDELRRLQAATQKELDALMPSILARAFAGEL